MPYRVKSLWFIIIILIISCSTRQHQWPEIKREHKPWTYWWWMGSGVDEDNITENLEALAGAGFGGVHVIPIYGVKGNEKQFIPYLSREWMRMLRHTLDETERLDMGVDLTTGTGWPFGGPGVVPLDADVKVIAKHYSVRAGERPDLSIDTQTLQALMAFDGSGGIIDLIDRIGVSGRLDWTPRDGDWELIAVSQTVEGARKVKRAAPGGEGYCVNTFSRTALDHYLARFDSAFSSGSRYRFRANYHDSYEYRGDWTIRLFDEFEKRRGYDLRDHLNTFFSDSLSDTAARVKSDYRETLSDLLLEDFITPWGEWSRKAGHPARNQAHGSPGNILDLYAAADIPETEIFGPSRFAIPGLRRNRDFDNIPPDPLALKFSSSAGHLMSRPLVSSETCTWLGEHFQTSLSQAKPELDQLWTCGINHIFYHGVAYSPANAVWPGWRFYASTHFGPTAGFWRDLPALNAYIGRVQSVLQAGRPDNDILIYWPFYDVLHDPRGTVKQISVHNLDDWLTDTPFYSLAGRLQAQGYSFDYISDRLLDNTVSKNGSIQIGTRQYSVLIVPECCFMPAATLKKILTLAESGARVIFAGKLPEDVPGLNELRSRRARFDGLKGKMTAEDDAGIKRRISITDEAEKLLRDWNITRESWQDHGLRFIRMKVPGGYYYFIAHLGGDTADGWIRLGTRAVSAELLDPFSGRTGLARIRKTVGSHSEIYIQLKAGQSLLIRTFSDRITEGEPWPYSRTGEQAIPVRGDWSIDFIEGGPVIPASERIDTLTSWTAFGGEAARFQGTALYRTVFKIPEVEADDWMLELGRVCESARIRINDTEVGTLVSLPFEINIGDFLRRGENVLEIEVTNLGANRIADMDRRGIIWRKFYDINFVNIQYNPFDASGWPPMESGLLGPVRLRPLYKKVLNNS